LAQGGITTGPIIPPERRGHNLALRKLRPPCLSLWERCPVRRLGGEGIPPRRGDPCGRPPLRRKAQNPSPTFVGKGYGLSVNPEQPGGLLLAQGGITTGPIILPERRGHNLALRKLRTPCLSLWERWRKSPICTGEGVPQSLESSTIPCHPERPTGVEGSTHLPLAVQIFPAKIPPRAPLGRDDILFPTSPYHVPPPQHSWFT